MKNKILFTLFILSNLVSFSQIETTWEDLAQVKFIDKYFADYEDYFLYPVFSDAVQELEGKQITIKGYFLSIDPDEKIYVLSQGPMSACFFCGQGGPETAVELQFTNKPTFKTDNIVAITGTLKLNKDDVEHFNYILTECKGILIE